MPKERRQEWEHVRVLNKKGVGFQVQCNYCDKQFWIGSGHRIRAHLGVQSKPISGVNKCERFQKMLLELSPRQKARRLLRRVTPTGS